MNDKPPSHHLIYKIWMFVELAEKRLGRCRHDRVLLNACVEARAIHARGLIDFLYKPQSGDDYAAGYHFENSEQWRDIRGPKPDDVKEIKDRISKNIPHLTFEQRTPEEGRQPPKWLRMEMIISSGLRKFFKKIPESDVCPCSSCKRILSLESVRALIGKH